MIHATKHPHVACRCGQHAAPDHRLQQRCALLNRSLQAGSNARKWTSVAVLVVNVLCGGSVVFSQASAQQPDGHTQEVKTERFTLVEEAGYRQTIAIELAAAGALSATAKWEGGAELALILNGPGQVAYYARQDGNSPLALSFLLTDDLLAKGRRWTLTLAKFGGAGPVEGTVTIALPPDSAVMLHAPPRALTATRTIQVGERVLALTIAPDGKLVLAGGGGGTGLISERQADVHVWREGVKLRTLEGHQARIRALAFAPDGKTFVSADGDPIAGGQAILWDANRRTPTSKHQFPTGGIYDATFSPSGKILFLAGGANSGLVELWDTSKGKVTSMLADPMGRVTGIAVSPDDTLLACGTSDKKVYIWEFRDKRLQKTLAGFEQAPDALAFSPDNTSLAVSGFYESKTQIYDTKNWLAGATYPSANRLRYSPDGRFLVIAGSGESNVTVWNPQQGVEVAHLEGLPDVPHSMVFSNNGRWLLTGDDNKICLWDLNEIRNALGK